MTRRLYIEVQLLVTQTELYKEPKGTSSNSKLNAEPYGDIQVGIFQTWHSFTIGRINNSKIIKWKTQLLVVNDLFNVIMNA